MKGLDPWKREKIIYQGKEKEWWNHVSVNDFIKRDLEDIDRSEILIAYLPRLSAGTCMELFYAKRKHKTTITITSIRNPSPWITYHSDILIRNIAELQRILEQINRTDYKSKEKGGDCDAQRASALSLKL